MALRRITRGSSQTPPPVGSASPYPSTVATRAALAMTVDAAAPILYSSITPGTAAQVLTTPTPAAAPVWAKLVDANIDAAAGIAGTKIQSASSSTYGVVTTGAQELAGAKTFKAAVTITNPTQRALTVTPTLYNGGTAAIESTELGDTQSMFQVTDTNGASVKYAEIGVVKHAGIASPCAYLKLESQDGAVNYLWTDDYDHFRISLTGTDVGTTSGDELYSSRTQVRTIPVNLLASGADSTVLAGTGGDTAFQQIDSTDFFASGARASASADGTLSNAAQSIAGVKTFNDGIVLDDAAGQSTLNWYQEADHQSTFTWNGTGSPGTSGTITLKVTRIGRLINLVISQTTATTGTGSNTLSANTVLLSWMRPAVTIYKPWHIADGSTQSVGIVIIGTSGSIKIQKADALAFTNGTTCGTDGAGSVSYYI